MARQVKPWLVALLALTGVRLVLAAILPLSPDEAYYWVWSRHLQPGYLDHPPMVAIFIWLGTALVGENALGVRLLGPVTLFIGSWMLARSTEDLFPGRSAGPWAAALMNATLFAALGAVTMTPDTPLLFFWVATLWAVARAHRGEDARWWLAAGVFAGAALLSKYTAALLGLGLVLWLFLMPEARRWLRHWQLWAGGALAMALFAPVIFWNAAHEWASFAKQGGRTAEGGAGQSLRWLGELLGGQVALVTPLVFLFCVAGGFMAARQVWRARDTGAGLLLALILPGAAIFLWQALGSRVQGNWPAILYPSAAIAAAALLPAAWRRWRIPALALGFAMAGAAYLQATAAPIPLPRRQDPTLARLGGWDGLAADLARAARREGAAFIAAEEYGLASGMAFRLPPELRVVAMDPRWRFFALPKPPENSAGLLIRSERRGEGPPLWPGATPVEGEAGRLIRARGGQQAEAYRLFRVTTAPGLPPSAVLPQARR
ncbi:MAG: glycosyltransferase family 39 protein [Roseomonas sp.]|nr:glycosyltransferase family 39 protein [Roseomonas sp.]